MKKHRKDDINNYFKLVKQFSTESGWQNMGSHQYKRQFGDKGQLGASYESRSGLSEILDTIRVNYGISVENKDQTIKQSISDALSGFQRSNNSEGFEILSVNGWDYPNLINTRISLMLIL